MLTETVAAAPKPPAKPIRPRSPGVALDASLPRHWFADNIVATHLANGVNLLFPAGERFFVRSVHRFLGEVDDPALRAQAKGFAGQEGRHAKLHEDVFRVMEAQGYDVARFLEVYERIAFGLIERHTSPELRLATTAACEHFTALMAEDALRLRVLDRAHPDMRALLLWHAAEEIEHRAVAFDVLQKVAPQYGLRVAGLAVATGCLAGFWALGTAMLLAQERDVSPARLLEDWRKLRAARKADSVFLRGIRAYLRPGFHPSQSDVDALAEEYLASAGLA